MESIALFTRDGHKVVDVSVPIFRPQADVLIWGSRYFVLDKADEMYYEGMPFVVTIQQP